MNKTRAVEVAVGMFVAAGLASLFMLAMKVSNLSAFGADDSYQVTARFNNIGGLKTRSPVRIGGVKIGRVSAIHYDSENYEAVVEMMISDQYDRLPDDTSASIFTAGLLGEQFIGLEPGGSDVYLQNDDEVTQTQSALVLEQLVGKFLFDKATETN